MNLAELVRLSKFQWVQGFEVVIVILQSIYKAATEKFVYAYT